MAYRITRELQVFSEEFQLLIEMLKGGDSFASANSGQLHRDINWDRFVHLAKHHRVFPTLYLTLKNRTPEWLPSTVLKQLGQAYQSNTLRMLQLTGEMERVGRHLDEQGVRTLFLKGPTLAHDLYGNVSCRTSKDLDVLVSIDDMDRVDSHLRQLGYDCEDVIPKVLNEWRWRQHHISYFHPAYKVQVEVHWRLSPGPCKEPRFEELWERRRACSLTRHPMYYLGREDLLYYLVTHGARHGWFRLRWLCDIDVAARQPIHWETLVRRMGTYQSRHLLGQALHLSSRLLDTPLPDKLQTIANQRRSEELACEAIPFIREMVENPPPELERKHKRHLFAIKSFRQKILFLLSFLYPYPMDAITLPLPKPVHFLYFPLRPLLWAWRKARKQAMT